MAMLDPAIASHALTPEERTAFERDGFLLIPDALDPNLRTELYSTALRRDRKFRSETSVDQHAILNEHDLVGKDRAWLDAIAPPRVFAKVLGIMGWNIQLFHTQLLVTPPAPANSIAGPYGWHQATIE
jgi:ectoine hydroxylase